MIFSRSTTHYPETGRPIGRFMIEKEISRTELSRLYRAYDINRCQGPDSGQFRAVLKFNAPDEKGHNYATLQKEVGLLRKFRHPGIVRIFPLEFNVSKNEAIFVNPYDTDSEQTNGYYAMEYLDGGSLDEHLEAIQTFSINWRLELFYQIVVIIHYLHNFHEPRRIERGNSIAVEYTPGYAYWDLKPRNIMFRSTPREDHPPMPVLIDFGSVTYADRLYDETISATAKYSPYEVVELLRRPDSPRDHVTPHKVDIWSLGALFFELMTGQSLVVGKRLEKIETTLAERRFARIREVNRQIPPELDVFLEFMIRTTPKNRASTTRLIAGLEEIMEPLWPPRL